MQSEAGNLVEDGENAEKRLQLKKLALEIADLERPWWKRPAYVLAALPTTLAFGTLLVGLLTGYFKAEYTKLENEKHDLQAEVKLFEGKRDDLHQQYEKAKKELEDKLIEGRSLCDYANYQAYQTHKCEEELRTLRK